ncbi:TRAP transporter small permease [Sansalvadorimonas sp. 2012CJ34-2]|uniref:TRAP transporter small permease protein n=1 Tax=Parendozoicomonas callyspongiae TaxID=2942213 RepID=A0ABT0PE35_9GAMM|nr:TRAP transporter small permease [Sansalvadorimonas sp. 2012CJ34-2]MCL6269622.1 TRAP transporter small permease [Sansalvadorimonas sp. 2012CJ34-2]
MSFFKKVDDFVSMLTEWALSASIVMMAIILISNVIARKLFSNSIPAADEIGATLIIFVTFVGIGYAARKGRHIRMSALFDAVPLKVQKTLIILISIVTCITYLYVCYISFEYIEYTKMLGRVTSALEIPAWIRLIVVPIGFGLGAIQYFLNIIINIKEPQLYIGTEKVDGGNGDAN